MEDGLEDIRGLFEGALRARLEETGDKLEKAEIEEFVTLVMDYFGQSLKGKPVRSNFRSLVDRIGSRLASDEASDG